VLETAISGDAIRIGSRFAVTFHRTLRIPDDGRAYPLPPGFGTFPVFGVSEFREHLPETWQEGTAFIPMHRWEALWLGFHGTLWKPNAAKVAVGGINALTGRADDARLRHDPQDYLVTPSQPWLDGINIGSGRIRQFVAVPLGQGDTVEAAITGEERYGGIQVTAFEPLPGVFPDTAPEPVHGGPSRSGPFASPNRTSEIGVGAGGAMRQKLYPDPHGVEVWDQATFGRAVIYLVDALSLQAITGLEPPSTPIDAKTYTDHGLPWFDLYDEDRATLPAAPALQDVESVAERDAGRGVPDSGPESFDVPDTQLRRIAPDHQATRNGTSKQEPGGS
jgi:hypothetical protein